MKALLTGGLELHGFPPEFVYALHDHFRVRNPAYQNVVRFSPHGVKYTNVPEWLHAGDVNKERAIFPRCITLPESLLSSAGSLANLEVEDQRVRAPARHPEPVLAPHAGQRSVLERFEKLLRRDEAARGWLLVAGTAFGKTILGLELLRRLKQRSVVIVHREIIKQAWFADAGKFYGSLSGVSLIQGPPSGWEIGKHLTIAMAQTLNAHLYEASVVLRRFGTLLLDEAHICPMNFIQTLVGMCPAAYRIGVTATPQRKDKLHQMLYWHFGEPAITTEKGVMSASQMQIAKVHYVWTRFAYKQAREDVYDHHELMGQLIHDDRRNALILERAERDFRTGHSVLVTTSRREHAELLHAELCRRTGKRDACAMLLGSMRKADIADVLRRIDRREVRALVATHQFICEGANIPRLDRLHVSVPLGDRSVTAQLCGRISRKAPGKTPPEVTVYLDSRCPSLRRMVSTEMMPAFRKLNIPGATNLWLA